MWMPHVWSAVRDALLSASAGGSGNKVGSQPRWTRNVGNRAQMAAQPSLTCHSLACTAPTLQKAEALAARLSVLLGGVPRDSGKDAIEDAAAQLPPCIQVCCVIGQDMAFAGAPFSDRA